MYPGRREWRGRREPFIRSNEFEFGFPTERRLPELPALDVLVCLHFVFVAPLVCQSHYTNHRWQVVQQIGTHEPWLDLAEIIKGIPVLCSPVLCIKAVASYINT